MSTFKTIAKSTSQKPEHVHATMFLEGELYDVKHSKNPEFALVSGIMGNSLGGKERVFDKPINVKDCRKHLVYVTAETEENIYPRYVISGRTGKREEYSLYKQYSKKQVGYRIRQHVGAPGIGYTDYLITKINDEGVFGVMVANTVQILSAADVM